MSEHSYTTTFTVEQTPAEVFAAVNDPRAWWGADIEGTTDQAGQDFTFEVPGVHYSKIRVTELVPGKLVMWRVVDARLSFVQDQDEWTGTEIRFELSEHDGGTELRFTHHGLIPTHECYDACSNAWSFYVGGSLRDLITTGVGAPSANPEEARFQEAARNR